MSLIERDLIEGDIFDRVAALEEGLADLAANSFTQGMDGEDQQGNWVMLGGWIMTGCVVRDLKAQVVLDPTIPRMLVGNKNTGSSIEVDGSTGKMHTSNYIEDVQGWMIAASGFSEFANVKVRGELRASVFAYEEAQTLAGAMVVAKSAGKLMADVTSSSTASFDVDIEDPASGHTQLFAAGDVLRVKGGGSENWWTVSSVSDQTTFYRYTCAWGNGTPATFRAGIAIMDYGLAGDGYIALSADGANDPQLAMFTHAGSPWSTTVEHLRLGNLNGGWGYAASQMGLAIGRYASGSANVIVDEAGDFKIRDHTTTKIFMQGDGDVLIGEDTAIPGSTHFALFSNAQTYNGEALGVGDLLLGDNTTGCANILWDKSAGQFQFRGGQTVQAYVDSAGVLLAGGGVVGLSSSGIQIAMTTSYADSRAYQFRDSIGGTLFSGFYAKEVAGTNFARLYAAPIAGSYSWLELNSDGGSGANCEIRFVVRSNAASTVGGEGAGVSYYGAQVGGDVSWWHQGNFHILPVGSTNGNIQVYGGIHVGSGSTAPDLFDVHIEGSINESTPLGCFVERQAVWTGCIPHNSWTALEFDTQIHDSDACWSSASPTRLISKHDGYYVVAGGVNLDDNGGGSRRRIGFRKNGSVWLGGFHDHPSMSVNHRLSGMTSFALLNANDYVEVMIHQDSGSAMTVTANTNKVTFGSIGRMP